jgi:hypothetical protein
VHIVPLQFRFESVLVPSIPTTLIWVNQDAAVSRINMMSCVRCVGVQLQSWSTRMLQNPVPHRHADGPVHYTHCHGEYDATRDARTRVCIVEPRRRQLGRLRLFGLSFGIATAAFWGVMLLSPPLTEAHNTPARLAPCLAAAGEVAPWFEREIRRRANLGNAAFERGGFKLMLLDYQSAQGQCAAGRVEIAVQGYRQLVERVTALSERDEPDER